MLGAGANVRAMTGLDPNVDPEYYSYLQKNKIRKISSYLGKLQKTDYDKYTYYMGIFSAGAGSNALAVAYYTNAILKQPDNPYLYEYRAVSHTALEEYDEAVSDANKAMSLLPDSRNPYFIRMQANILKKDYDAALKDLETAKTMPAGDNDILTDKQSAAAEILAKAKSGKMRSNADDDEELQE